MNLTALENQTEWPKKLLVKIVNENAQKSK